MRITRKKLLVATVIACAAIGGVACGGSSGGDDDEIVLTDANGAFDITEEDVFRIFGAISAECTTTVEESPDSVEECKEVCNCSARAVAGLEGRTESPLLVERCEVACDPNFAGTPDLPIPADDEDDLPELERFFEAYIVKCDEIASRTVFTDGDATQECIETCVCIADSIEQYVSQEADDNLRSQCESSCQTPPTTATGKVLRPMLSAGF